MNAQLDQLRAGVTAHIAEDPTVITPMRQPLISDGYGGSIRSGAAVAQARARIRIQHESGSVQGNQVGPSGLDTNLSLYVLTDYRAPLQEGDTFTWAGFTWTVGPMNAFRQRGGVYKTEAPLVKGTAVPVTIPEDLAAAAVSASAIDLTWSAVGAVDSYSLERRKGNGSYLEIITPAAGVLLFHDTGLEAATVYTYRIRAYNGSTWSAYSAEVSATTEAGA